MESGNGAGGTGGDAGADAGGQGAADAAPDVTGRLDQLSSNVGELHEMLSGLASAGSDAGDGEDADPLAGFDSEMAALLGYSQDGAADEQAQQQVDPQALASLIQSQIQQQVDQRVAPLTEQVETDRRMREAEALATEFPEMRDPKIAGEVVQFSQQFAEMVGNPALASEPLVHRVLYLAGRAADAANEEDGAEAPGVAHLEGGGGAGAGAGQQVSQVIDSIRNADGAGAGSLPFG